MNFLPLLKHITNHPLNRNNKSGALMRFAKWQVKTLISARPTVHLFTQKSKLIVAKGMTGATQNVYCGLQDYEDMFFLLHFLRPEDLFADIGANVGSYTVLAGAHVGAKVISFEPVPTTYQLLLNNIVINHIEARVTALNIALGSEEGTLNFTASLDTQNHVAVAGEENVIKVSIGVLDRILQNEFPSLLKIDVEGFETEVLKGASATLEKDSLKAIIIELNGSGLRYGYNEEIIHNSLLNFGFEPHVYHPAKRVLQTAGPTGHSNTIYIRDKESVLQRLQAAEKVRILNQSI